ncbi:MAG: hypothetical protein JO287_05030 [Pseudonocardiales bacterium]|nr:hypothetical protein [Pseudonocardiales bacterium]
MQLHDRYYDAPARNAEVEDALMAHPAVAEAWDRSTYWPPATMPAQDRARRDQAMLPQHRGHSADQHGEHRSNGPT